MKTELLELAPLLARRDLWLLVSTASLDPYHRERFALLRDPDFRRRALQAASLVTEEQPPFDLVPGEIHPQELSLPRLFYALDDDWAGLEPAYRQLFGLTAVSTSCPPCEVEYEPNPDITYRAQRMADIAGFYQAFGLQVSGHAGERLDHLTVQAEFLYVLLAKEAAAREEENVEAAEICREARRKFFEEHVGWWLPAFSRLLSRVAPAPFYRELASLTASLSAAERVALSLPPFQVPHAPKPAPAESAGGCFGCMGA
ncbi:MAG: molecular chaperone TorD family protein [Acidobacteria bacterium]|nr:molecular chaperone TorD family protein [Acidobacteriota bacterium]